MPQAKVNLLFPVCLNLFVFLFLETPCFVVAVQPCMEWIPVKKKSSDRLLGRNDISPNKENFRPDTRQNFFLKKRRTSRACVPLKTICSSSTLISITFRQAHVHQHLKEPQQFLNSTWSLSLSRFSLSAMQLHIKCVQRRSCPKQDKKQQSIGTKSFYSNTSYDFEYKKTASVNCLLKSS